MEWADALLSKKWGVGWTGWIDTPYTMTTRAPAVLKNNNTYQNANLDHL